MLCFHWNLTWGGTWCSKSGHAPCFCASLPLAGSSASLPPFLQPEKCDFPLCNQLDMRNEMRLETFTQKAVLTAAVYLFRRKLHPAFTEHPIKLPLLLVSLVRLQEYATNPAMINYGKCKMVNGKLWKAETRAKWTFQTLRRMQSSGWHSCHPGRWKWIFIFIDWYKL